MVLIAACLALAVAAEALIAWRMGRPVYTYRETEFSLSMLAGWLLLMIALPATTQWAPRLLHYTPPRMPAGLGGGLLLVLCGDFVLYWSHRMSHTLRWQWAAHQAHHSSERLNFLASLRQGWTDLPAGMWLYTLPLAFLGFSAEQWTAYFVASLIWQMFVHNEWAPKLGVLEAVLVTPSHHRVHHALATGAAPRNFGNIFIVWDRLFGTFTPEGAERLTRFGVAGRDFAGIGDIAFGEWRALLADLRRRPKRR